MSLADRILEKLAVAGCMTDRQLTDELLGAAVHPSPVNQACRALAAQGRLFRQSGPDGRIANTIGQPEIGTPTCTPGLPRSHDTMTEDEVKEHLVRWLRADGWDAQIAWGKQRGIDIDARRGAERWIIEAKGSGSLQPMRVNYFLGMLGETLQRMSDPAARFSIAMPDLAQFRGLWERLPPLAKRRTTISALFVRVDGRVDHCDA